MHRATSHQFQAPRRRKPTHSASVCVVDRRAADHQGWRGVKQTEGGQVLFVSTAAEALRVARAKAIDLWVVNADLPDLSGAALCTMLKSQAPRSPVLMVADSYSPDEEQAALAARATAFLVKPVHDDWLAEWISTLSIPANTGPA